MEKDYLVSTAKKIKPVSKESADEYIKLSDSLVSKLNEQMLSRPDLDKLVGSDNIDMMKNNHSNHARFIASILRMYNPEVFVETVLWVFSAYMQHGFSSQYWAAQLSTWIDLLQSELSEKAYNEIYPYYEWLQTNIPGFVSVSKQDEASSQNSH